MRTSERACVEALREAADRLGESPTKAAYEDLGLTPASATIIRVMGGWNAAKEAAGLETYHSRGSRVGPKPDSVDLPDGRTWQELTVDQRWHYRNPDRNAERTRERRSELRRWVNDLKRERGCERCTEDDPDCLDFHHVDDENKRMAITRMVTFGYGKDELRTEIDRCEVLCANCHRREHADAEVGQLRRWVRRYKRTAGGCVRCDETEPASLDFHHDGDEKGDTVANLISDGRPREVIRAEIANCTLLCANCHRTEHAEPREGIDDEGSQGS